MHTLVARPQSTRLTLATGAGDMSNLWICEACGFLYDPAEGDPDGGIAPGTPFEEIPNDWVCPMCGARKRDFVPFEG